MNVENASKCLKHLVKSIKAALDELHGLEFSHNNIRLPNICFDTNYQAVRLTQTDPQFLQRIFTCFILKIQTLAVCTVYLSVAPNLMMGITLTICSLGGWLHG